MAQAGRFSWIDGGRHTTDITFVDNAVEGLLLGWTSGKPGQAYFVTDREPVQFREFMQTVFDIYGVDTPIPDIALDTAAQVVPVPASWFIGQTCTLRTDKAVKASATGRFYPARRRWTSCVGRDSPGPHPRIAEPRADRAHEKTTAREDQDCRMREHRRNARAGVGCRRPRRGARPGVGGLILYRFAAPDAAGRF